MGVGIFAARMGTIYRIWYEGIRDHVMMERLLAAVLGAGLVAASAVPAAAAPSEYDCLIEARQSLDIRPAVEGVIESVLVRRGDAVRKGAVIATLLSGPERAALDVARSRASMEGELKSALARVDLTQKKFDRATELHRQNFVSVNARDEAEAEYRLAVEQLQVARENQNLAQLEVKRAEEILAQRSIRSPINGLVVEVLLQPGSLTSSNQKDPVMKMMEVDPLHVELVLPVSEHGKIKRGQRGEVRPEPPVGGRYSARVDVVDGMLDAASGTFGVRLTLANPGNRIPAGVKCKVRF
jgi:RND family efflux transporter MFP subunit